MYSKGSLPKGGGKGKQGGCKGKQNGGNGKEPNGRHERDMYEVIEWLLAVPEAERQRMELAESFIFTEQNPAPAFGRPAGAAAPSAIGLLEMGTVEAALFLAQKGFRPAVLNFAHGYNCGGGFEHAGGSQEEDIFRKTSVFLSLWPHRRVDDGPGVLKRGMWIGNFDEALKRKEAFYPHTAAGGIYSPHVRIIRNLCAAANPLFDGASVSALPTVAVLTAAAQQVGFDGPFRPQTLAEKARTILWMAATKGHDSVVLGAFGCGYFKNPAEVVAETFRKLLGPRGEFENVFRVVVFAVIGGNDIAFTQRFKAFDTNRFLATPGLCASNQDVEQAPQQASEADKEIMKLKKKLRDIQKLKEKPVQELDTLQKRKIEGEVEIVARLQELGDGVTSGS